MINKIINAVVGLFFLCLIVFAIGKTMQNEQEFAKKCEALGMIVVNSFKARPYCAKGARP